MQNERDVIVVGGGLAGVSCALRIAESGKTVLLVERRPALGWESTWAGQLSFQGANSSIAQRIRTEVDHAGGVREDIVDAPILEIALDRLIKSANISLLLYTYPLRLVYEGETAFGVVLGNRNGEQVVYAKAIVDATEEALLWSQTNEQATSPAVATSQPKYSAG